MPIYLWIIELFSFLLFVHSVNAAINPGQVVNWTIDRYKNILKFYCFDCEIKSTPKSIKVIRIGHIIVAIILFVYMALLLYFGVKY